MKMKWNIWDVLWFVIPVGIVCMANVLSQDLLCTEVDIKFRESEQNYFLKENQILEEIEGALAYTLKGGKLIHNDLNKIENVLKRNKFVRSAKVLSDHKGRILIDIVQECPIARIMNKDSSYYLTETGRVMPTSYNYTSRVMVVLGTKINDFLRQDSLANLEQKEAFVELVSYINNDEFLKAQIAVIEVLENNKIVLYPQVTHQKIEFGNCGNYVDKLERLKIFYKQILPRKGWTSYSKVNLEYKNQIICE